MKLATEKNNLSISIKDKGVEIMISKRKKKSLVLATNLTSKEYDNLKRFLENRKQGYTEYALLSIGQLKEEDFKDLSILKGSGIQKKIMTLRASQWTYEQVNEIAKEKKLPVSSVLKIAIREAIQD